MTATTKRIITTLTLGKDSGYYEAFQYPAGETQVRFVDKYIDDIKNADEVRVIARIQSAGDIIDLAGLCNAINNLNFGAALVLILPYLPYARADRRFTPGDCHGLEMFGKILASMQVTQTRTLDVHSKEAFLKIPNLVDCSPDSLISAAMRQFADRFGALRITVLFPDAGAAARYRVADQVWLDEKRSFEVVVKHATKKRNNTTGKFEGFSVPSVDIGAPLLIIDDICDGGGTFLGIAAELNKLGHGGKRGLYVTHGIFSKGLGELAKSFDAIYCSNSFSSGDQYELLADAYDLVVFDAMPELLKRPKE